MIRAALAPLAVAAVLLAAGLSGVALDLPFGLHADFGQFVTGWHPVVLAVLLALVVAGNMWDRRAAARQTAR